MEGQASLVLAPDDAIPLKPFSGVVAPAEGVAVLRRELKGDTVFGDNVVRPVILTTPFLGCCAEVDQPVEVFDACHDEAASLRANSRFAIDLQARCTSSGDSGGRHLARFTS